MEQKSNSSALLVFLSLLLLGVITTLGIAAAIYTTNIINRHQETALLTRAKTAALALPSTDLLSLTGTEEDINKDSYKTVKETLVAIREANPDVRFAYLMKHSGSTLIFMADSEAESSADYSPPGDVYYEAERTEFDRFIEGVPFVMGPTTDRWGSWYTAYAPIVDADGKHLMSLGLDVSAKVWHAEMWFARGMIALATLLVGLLVITMAVYSSKVRRVVAWLERTHEELKQSREYLAEAERLAKLGRFSWNVITGSMTWNTELYKIFEVPLDEKITFDTLEDLVVRQDKERFKTMLNDALHSTDDTFTLDFRIETESKSEKHLYAICSVKRSPKGEAIRVIGALQDITERDRRVRKPN